MTGLDDAELRALVRGALRELLPTLGGAASANGSAGGIVPHAPEPVVLRDDADLQVFVARVVALAQDPATAEALRDGRHRFTLAHPVGPAPGSRGSPGAGTPVGPQRITRGPVLERHVRAAAAAGSRIIAGPGVVVTPLARERARASGVEIVTERSDA